MQVDDIVMRPFFDSKQQKMVESFHICVADTNGTKLEIEIGNQLGKLWGSLNKAHLKLFKKRKPKTIEVQFIVNEKGQSIQTISDAEIGKWYWTL